MLKLEDISVGFVEEAKGYPLTRAYVFGSRARGDATHESDIDIVLDVEKDFSLLDLCGIKNSLEKRFGVPCDVVTRRSLRDDVRKSVELDEVLIYEVA